MSTGQTSNSGGSVEYVNDIPNAPKAAPFFSQVVWAGDTAYLAGQIGLDPSTMKLVEGGLARETEQTFDNIEATLEGVGLTLNDVAKVTIYLADIAEIGAMNEIYSRRFGNARPARETVAVKGMAFGAKIEITMTAYRGR